MPSSKSVETITVAELAERTGVSIKTVWNWHCTRGADAAGNPLPTFYKVKGRKGYAVIESEADAFIKQRSTVSLSDLIPAKKQQATQTATRRGRPRKTV